MMRGRGYEIFNNCFGYGVGPFNHGIGMFMMIGFIILAAVAFIFIFSRMKKRKTDNLALEALKIRLVKGEISEEEYLRKKNILD